MLRKAISTGAPFCLAATVVSVSDKKSKSSPVTQEKDELAHFKCKPSDLPLYKPLHELSGKPKDPSSEHQSESAVRKNLESGISVVRKEVFGAYNAVASQKKIVDDTFSKGKEQTKFIIDYLNEPANAMPRVGAIAIGGAAGFIFALRGGFIRRILFTGIGAGGIASICYPKDAEIYAQHGIVEAKKYTNIAYNFVFGVKPGDDVNAPNWPKIPTNLTELGESLSDIARSAKDALTSSKK